MVTEMYSIPVHVNSITVIEIYFFLFHSHLPIVGSWYSKKLWLTNCNVSAVKEEGYLAMDGLKKEIKEIIFASFVTLNRECAHE